MRLQLLVMALLFLCSPRSQGKDRLISKITSSSGITQINKTLAYKYLKPNSKVLHEVYLPDGSPLLTATYNIDHFGHRKTHSLGIEEGKRHSLFFGCSFVFGAKLNDQDTLPSHFAQQNPEYWSVNFGISGYGVFDVLRQMELDLGRYRRGAPEGFAFYLYLPFHRDRSAGSFFETHHIEWTPQYRWRDHQLKYVGSWAEIHPILSWFLALTKKLEFSWGTRLLRGLPGVSQELINNQLHESVFQAFLALRRQYLLSFPKGRFIAGLGPNLTEQDEKMFRKLNQNKVEILDLRELPFSTEVIHPLDLHPNGKLNQLIAEKISIYLSETSPSD
ncbi:MAG: hypothetical protein KDD43_09315 [Bdellovibrionales bacterium]|nr:hypothetical protein [Bdellovibrionales bacterium]